MDRMPILFLGHGSPMNAIEENDFSRAWTAAGKALPVPKAILCISAHWETNGTRVTAMKKPRTIHDFYGFPEELYAIEYPAPGSPGLAEQLQELLGRQALGLDLEWGLDHGSWSVLRRLFPGAKVPVVQLSLDVKKTPRQHYDLGRELQPLREADVLVMGSGNIVHNLQRIIFKDIAYDWAVAFDSKVRNWVIDEDHESLIQFDRQGLEATLAVNSAEHFKPLLYVLGAQHPGEKVTFFAEKIWGGSLSMRSMQIG